MVQQAVRYDPPVSWNPCCCPQARTWLRGNSIRRSLLLTPAKVAREPVTRSAVGPAKCQCAKPQPDPEAWAPGRGLWRSAEMQVKTAHSSLSGAGALTAEEIHAR